MAPPLPLKLTQAQTEDMKHRLHQIAEGFIKRGLDPQVVTMELAMVCARYAVNAGILDQHRLPPETTDDQNPTPTPPTAVGGRPADRGPPAGGEEDHDDGA